jgi:hypothetical protein
MSKSKHFSASLIVLLTSTLQPRGASAAKIEERKRQYREAVEFWLAYPDQRIAGLVYCDNSSPDLAWVHDLAKHSSGARRLETLYYPENEMPSGVHYGYPELGIVDHCLRNSALLAECEYFAKVTGRLKFPRFMRLLDKLPASLDACIDYRAAYGREKKTWAKFRARTQLMLFRTEFYRQQVQDQRALMVTGHTAGMGITHIEELLPGILIPGAKGSERVVFRWPVECPPSGVGGNGDNFDGARRRIKSLAFSGVRRFIPFWWI